MKNKERRSEQSIRRNRNVRTAFGAKKSQLADVLDPVCHSSASNSALKEPTASEQLSRLPHSRRFIEIYEKGSTTKERVERLKMVAYVLNLKLPGEVCRREPRVPYEDFKGK